MKRRQFIKGMALTALATAIVPGKIFASEKSANKAGNSCKSIKTNPVKVNDGWDVIVAGGGPAGCAAAIASAREGARTLLIERSGVLGGMGTSGLLNAWCPFSDGKEIIYKGIAERIFLESRKAVPHANYYDWVPINCEYLKRVYDDFVMESGAKVLFFSSIASVEMKDEGIVDAVIVANKAGLTAYRAKVFIDCTGDGDLAVWAGAGYHIGDDDGKVQSGSLCFSVANVNSEKYRSVGSWNSYSPAFKMKDSPDYPLVNDAFMNDKVIAKGFIGFNAGHIEVDSTDPESVSQAMIKGRRLAAELYRGLRQFEPEAFGESTLAATASMMGIRESRRIVCDYTFTLRDWGERREFEDNIGRNNYYIDVHKDNAATYPSYTTGESHGIPYRCLTPKGLSNVLVAGRCISTDHYALGSLRVMPPSMVTGEAVGTAAAFACRQSKPDVHNLNVQDIRKRLVEMGQRVD